MNINLTLIGQMLTFAIVVWFTMRYVWPPLTKALSERQKQIADALAAAAESMQDREITKKETERLLAESKVEAARILDQAHKRAQAFVEQAKTDAKIEAQRIIEAAKVEMAREILTAKQELRQEVANMAIASAEKILKREVNAAANQALIDETIQSSFN